MISEEVAAAVVVAISFVIHYKSANRMKSNLLVIAAAVLLTLTGVSQETAAPIPLELVALNSAFEAKEKELDTEIAPKLATLKQQCLEAIKAGATKLNNAKKGDDAEKVLKEGEWFLEHGQVVEPAKTTPAEVKAAYAAYLRGVQTVEGSILLKRASVRTKYGQDLVPLARSLTEKGDKAGAAAVFQARQSLAIRNVISSRGYMSTGLGKKTPLWQDIHPEGGVLVGFEVKKGAWFQFSVAKGVRPIYRTATGLQRGIQRGPAGKDQEVIAKDGYAVGGVLVRLGSVLDAFQVVFMKVKPDGLTLDPADRYVSEWLGGNSGKAIELHTRGRVAIGITGSMDKDTVEALGLVGVK